MRADEMKIEIRRLDQIPPYEKNARKIPQRAIDKVAASLEVYGWQQPIVVDKNGVIVVGHVRRLAALQLGWTEAPVTVFQGTAAQARAYRLMDNRSHQEAGWDLDLLGPELAELKELSFDLNLTGFDIRDCRTPALGGHLDTCPECGQKTL
jgi:ParB-like chromosome segregation protein Spo0J